MARLWSPRQTPNIGRRSSSLNFHRSLTNPISSGLSGEPGPGPITTASKYGRWGWSECMSSSSFFMMVIEQFWMACWNKAARLYGVRDTLIDTRNFLLMSE